MYDPEKDDAARRLFVKCSETIRSRQGTHEVMDNLMNSLHVFVDLLESSSEAREYCRDSRCIMERREEMSEEEMDDHLIFGEVYLECSYLGSYITRFHEIYSNSETLLLIDRYMSLYVETCKNQRYETQSRDGVPAIMEI